MVALRSPETDWAWTLPLTVWASTGPASRTRVIPPLALWTVTGAVTPEMTASEETEPSSSLVPAGTASETTARRLVRHLSMALESDCQWKSFQVRSS